MEKALASKLHFRLEGIHREIGRVVDCHIPSHYWGVLFDHVSDIDDEPGFYAAVSIQLVSYLCVDWNSNSNCASHLLDNQKKKRGL